MIIKATRLQALGGGGRVGRRPPPLENKKFFGYIEGLFATFSSNGGIFSTFSHIWGPFHHVGAFLLLLLHGGGLFLGLPPPLRELLRAPMIAMQGGFESILPGNFLCDRNLRFCLKNDKYTDKL